MCVCDYIRLQYHKAEQCRAFFLQLRGSPQLQPSSAKFEVESPIILHVDFTNIALKNVKFADVSLVGDHILAVSFSSVAEFFQKVSSVTICLVFNEMYIYVLMFDFYTDVISKSFYSWTYLA